MNDTEMYPIRNVISNDINVQLPTCMYKMKNIHSSKRQIGGLSNNAGDGNITEQDISLPDLLLIENRQKRLLIELEELKVQLLRVKSILKLERPEKDHFSQTCKNVNLSPTMTQLPNILIRANPKSPPYSLLFVQKLLRNQWQIILTSHLHSNIDGIDENAQAFLKKFNDCDGGNGARFTTNIRLIWNNLEINQMESCIDNSWIFGEVNLLRYITRLISNTHYKQHNVDDVDYMLDTIYQTSYVKSSEVGDYLEIFNSYLTKNSGLFLCGNELSIADIAAWSLLKQLKDLKLNVSLSKWMNKCDNIVFT